MEIPLKTKCNICLCSNSRPSKISTPIGMQTLTLHSNKYGSPRLNKTLRPVQKLANQPIFVNNRRSFSKNKDSSREVTITLADLASFKPCGKRLKYKTETFLNQTNFVSDYERKLLFKYTNMVNNKFYNKVRNQRNSTMRFAKVKVKSMIKTNTYQRKTPSNIYKIMLYSRSTTRGNE